jgi:hypothetical protein
VEMQPTDEAVEARVKGRRVWTSAKRPHRCQVATAGAANHDIDCPGLQIECARRVNPEPCASTPLPPCIYLWIGLVCILGAAPARRFVFKCTSARWDARRCGSTRTVGGMQHAVGLINRDMPLVALGWFASASYSLSSAY